jgi:hypothetical protein
MRTAFPKETSQSCAKLKTGGCLQTFFKTELSKNFFLKNLEVNRDCEFKRFFFVNEVVTKPYYHFAAPARENPDRKSIFGW